MTELTAAEGPGTSQSATAALSDGTNIAQMVQTLVRQALDSERTRPGATMGQTQASGHLPSGESHNSDILPNGMTGLGPLGSLFVVG